jgi:peptide/nickel transport system permease protein
MIMGSRVSLKVGFSVVFFSVTFGLIIGSIAGYFGGIIEELIMRLIDILLAFPGILLAIALVSVLGPSLNNVIFSLSLISWVGYARLVRGQILKIRELDFVQAARAVGAGPVRVMIRHYTPNLAAPLLVQATLGMAGAIIAEAGLSFLGLGVQPPASSWGSMLNNGADFITTAPYLTFFPGLAIMLVVLSLNFLGDGLRDILDPKQAAKGS